MAATRSPRPSDRPTYRDPHAVDLRWAMGRARDWLLGPAPLVADLSLFVFVSLGALLWRIGQNPDGFSLPGWVVVWGVLVAIHAGVVVAYGTLRAVRSPRRGPVYYHEIPHAERRSARRPAVTSFAPVMAERPTWQGVLAPVTPFPTLRGTDRPGTSLPAAPDQADVTAVRHPAPVPSEGTSEFEGPWPAAARRDSALADVRDVLASDQPLWRRWRRRAPDRSEPADLPIDPDRSWLSPFPGEPPVTRPARNPAAPLVPAATGEAPATTPPLIDRRWPASVPPNGPVAPAHAADSEQIPSLAAMLRSSNLTTLADAPISPRPPRPAADDATPTELPAAPIPFSRSPGAAPARPGTSALFAALGIDSDGKPVRTVTPHATTETSGTESPDRPTAPSGKPSDRR